MGKLLDQAKAEVERKQQIGGELEKQKIAHAVEDILGSKWVPLLEFSSLPIYHAILDRTICIYFRDFGPYFYPLCPSCRKNPALYHSYFDQLFLSWEAIATEVGRARPCGEYPHCPVQTT